MSYPRLCWCICLFLLLGCQLPTKKERRLLIWPLPPDQPRFIYEATLWSSEDIKKKQQKSSLERVMRLQEPVQAKEALDMMKPYDVAVGEGKIYITDTAMALVHVFNLSQRRYFRFGYRLQGKLEKPTGIAVDARGRVYITDVKQRRVVVYDDQGLYLREIKYSGFQFPTDVAVNSKVGKVFVVDRGGIESVDHGVVVFDLQGKFLYRFGKRGYAQGEFNLPTSIAVNSLGRVVVLDGGNFRVQVFSEGGKFLQQWGSVGRGLGQFARPRGLAVDRDDNVYVSDAIFGNVQIFNAKGQLLLPIGERYRGDQPGHYPLVAGVAVDKHNNLLVLDQYFRKLEILRRLSDDEGLGLLRELNKPEVIKGK